MLHEPELPDKKLSQESKNQTLPVLVDSHHKSNCYLQVISVFLSNGSFKFKTNVLLDSRSDSTFVSQNTEEEKIDSCKYQMFKRSNKSFIKTCRI